MIPCSEFAFATTMAVLLLMVALLFIGNGCGFVSIRNTWRMHLGDVAHRKKHEVEELLKNHVDMFDRLNVRLGFAADDSSYHLRRTLRRGSGYTNNIDALHQIAVVPDIKRSSPTHKPHEIASFPDAGDLAVSFRDSGADAFMIGTDLGAWGGSVKEFTRVVELVKYSNEDNGPPVIFKDVIVHPIQLAVAAESGATAALLMACVVGRNLEEMLDTATIMGFEVIVEVHTPQECEKALEYGANCIVVNQWDRITGELYPKQAKLMRRMLPNEIISIATGGISTLDEIAALADEGYDAVVIGKGLVSSGNPCEMIRKARHRLGLPRRFLGLGLRAEDLGV